MFAYPTILMPNLVLYCKQSIFVWNHNQEMGEWKDVKEEERAFIMSMAKAGASNHKDCTGYQTTKVSQKWKSVEVMAVYMFGARQ